MKRILSILILGMAFILTTIGQEGLYYYGSNSKIVQTKEEAQTYQEVKKKSEKRYTIITYTLQDYRWVKSKKENIRVRRNTDQKITYYEDNFFPRNIYRKMTQIRQGVYTFDESNRYGTLRSGKSTRFLPLHLDGTAKEYYKNGQLKSNSIYRDNQLISNENWLIDGTKYIDSIFYSVDVKPIYQMAEDYFRNYIIIRMAESELNLDEYNDEVLIGFVIMETGQIRGVQVLKGKSLQLNQFLADAITHLPGEWTPAQLDGAPVRYYITIPMNFIQKDANFQDLEISSGLLFYNRY